MTVRVEKPSINVREKLAELDKPTGIAGEAMLRAETPQEQFNLIGAGRRNLIINGAMQVNQRGGGATTFSYATVDRWKPTEGSTSTLAITQEPTNDAPSGFGRSYKITTTTAETMSGSKQLAVFHAIEAQNLQQLGYGTSDAQSITVSFWVKSSVTGAYCLSLYENDDNRNIGATYTINSANTWEYKTITFPPDTVGVINNDNGAGLETYFFLSVGPDRKTADNTSWGTWTAGRFGYGQVADVAGTTNATWQITGVQLEVGKVATPFEHRSFGEELAACKRYYEQSYVYGTYAGSSNTYQGAIFFTAAHNDHREQIRYEVEKRATPTVTLYSSGNGATGFWYSHQDNTNKAVSASHGNGPKGVRVDVTTVDGHRMDGHFTADAEL
jgi:hypothetical protein